MLHIFAMFLALFFPATNHHVKSFDVIGGGGPGVIVPTPAPADVIGGGGPGKVAPTPAPLDVIGGGGPGL